MNVLERTIRAMVRGILETPGDRTLRMILADAMEEHVANNARISLLRSPTGYWTFTASEMVPSAQTDGKFILHWVPGHPGHRGIHSSAGFREHQGTGNNDVTFAVASMVTKLTCEECKKIPQLRVLYGAVERMVARYSTQWRWLCPACYRGLRTNYLLRIWKIVELPNPFLWPPGTLDDTPRHQ